MTTMGVGWVLILVGSDAQPVVSHTHYCNINFKTYSMPFSIA